MPALTSSAEVASAINERMARLGKTSLSVARAANLNKSATAAFDNLLAGSADGSGTELKPSHLKALAEALEFGDPVVFATKAYRLFALAAADREIQRDLRPR